MKTITLNQEKVKDYLLKNDFNDLDLIHFLKSNIDKELLLVGVDSINYLIQVKESEKSKIYTYPATLFNFDDDEDEDYDSQTDILYKNSNSEQNQNNIIQKIFFHKNDVIKYWIILLLFSYIIVKPFIPSNANILTTGPVSNKIDVKIKNDFEILTEKANKNREVISQELQEQKRLRDLEKESIQRVKNLEKENQEIRNNLIQLSQ